MCLNTMPRRSDITNNLREVHAADLERVRKATFKQVHRSTMTKIIYKGNTFSTVANFTLKSHSESFILDSVSMLNVNVQDSKL